MILVNLITVGFLLIRSGLGQVLNPPLVNLAAGKKVTASATCGLADNGEPIRELYCDLTGASQYSPAEAERDAAAAKDIPAPDLLLGAEARERLPIVQGGQNCQYCDASKPDLSHPPEHMVDGTVRWWQSPPFSRGMKYKEINITIDFEQEFHVAYVFVKMANSPRPAVWILERSNDYGKTYQPWQYFAETYADCGRLFGVDSLQPITSDDTVICSTEFAQIVPLENGEMSVSIVNDRPSNKNFSYSETLQRWTRATNVRIRLLQAKTLLGHLQLRDSQHDTSVTRRFFYGIKEIEMGGRCLCHGHAETCDILDEARPNRLLCRCQHHTCGDQCSECCPGFVQKKWRPSREGEEFECEPCQCYGHSNSCLYDPDADEKGTSIDIHGNYEGGGVCQDCQHHTTGINCHECAFGFYRPQDRALDAVDVCQACTCSPYYHTGDCKDGTGECYCNEHFQPPHCDSCAKGYYNYPECKPCDCNVNGTSGDVCLPETGQCPCKSNYAGIFCEICAPGYHDFPACTECTCSEEGSVNNICNETSGQCPCKPNFADGNCGSCADGYYNFPACSVCECDPAGTEEAICDKTDGKCICKEGFAGARCDRCNITYFGYPNCQSCNCNKDGSKSTECSETGQCTCRANFTGKACDRCAPGYFLFPECNACNCGPGSKGISCDDQGQCFCKSNFGGQKCDTCRSNFYNYPICEECNCAPEGVPLDFGGCDKVAPGELCECKERVTGRICNQCKPTFWDLKYANPLGCDDCDCDRNGVVSGLNICDQQSGQCRCKLNVQSRRCDTCRAGFYKLDGDNSFGCSPCDCDIGGAVGHTCDPQTGKCFCRPRVNGRQCQDPLDMNFYPSLHHMQYEAEKGSRPDGTDIRFSSDATAFPDFSWKGFVVFSPIQEEIIIHVDAKDQAIFHVLAHYKSPKETMVDVTFKPVGDVKPALAEQMETMKFPAAEEPTTLLLTKERTRRPVNIVIQGKWDVHFKAPTRMYLDYIVLLPQSYFEPSVLRRRVEGPCTALQRDTSTCLEFKAIPLPRDAVESSQFADHANYPAEKLPTDSSAVQLASDPIEVTIDIPQAGKYHLFVDYYQVAEEKFNANVEIADQPVGSVLFHHCPFSQFCRNIVSSPDGQPAAIDFIAGEHKIFITPNGTADTGLFGVTAIPENLANMDLLNPIPYCIRKDGKCHGFEFATPVSGPPVEAESGRGQNMSIGMEDVEFEIDSPETRLIAMNGERTRIDIIGSVSQADYYNFVVHYYQPDHTNVELDVGLFAEQAYQEKTGISFVQNATLLNETSANAYVSLPYCPGVSGCRAVIKQRKDNSMQFPISEKFLASFFLKDTSQAVYIDKVIPLRGSEFYPDLLKPQPYLDVSERFLDECAQDNFAVGPEASEFCRQSVFSITTGFNNGALECECNQQGSTSFMCEKYAGKCSCKPNVVGRTCSECAAGYWGFPDCKQCNCLAAQQCDAATGQCLCPPFTVGTNCDACAPNAYGFDPLIGCQECDCKTDGTVESGDCDAITGQCKCKANVGGRKCERCQFGYYGFPYCYQCNCEQAGSVPGEICDQNSAHCICKENVHGGACEKCKSGTFNLQLENPKGCTECFCFGTTDQCSSSVLEKSSISQMNGWEISNVNNPEIAVNENVVEATIDEAMDPGLGIYFVAPKEYLSKRLFSYGGKLKYTISNQPKSSSTPIDVKLKPDVLLKGHNLTLEYFLMEQPPDPKEPFNVEVDLSPSKWMLHDSSVVTRPQMMLVLNDLMGIHIKASYYAESSSAKLENVVLDSAIQGDNYYFALRGEEGKEQKNAATSVEACRCPPPYNGTSCEECAEGYYRVHGGSYLGACIPCQCNGHSNRCNPTTGICHDCQHNTEGDHCERCISGHFGNATEGTPFDCLVCPCPSPRNNFAHSCKMSHGVLESCDCKTGYAGIQCERCDTGYFGQPIAENGICQPCNCSGNNNLSDPSSCNHVSGHCSNCQDNTAGSQCHECAPWYFGDAVTSKNCAPCECNTCGSVTCDNKSGTCGCKPNVEGILCNRCVANHWGFDQCYGCQPCNCGEASLVPQCDLGTGQCACADGVEGLHCDRCAHGYWNYSPQGCKRCDCFADLSLGTICDVQTGYCQCQAGATGPRCDQCIQDYLKVPKEGCMYCDECIHNLAADLDTMQMGLANAEKHLGNISIVYFTSKRLQNIIANTDLYDESLKDISHQWQVLDKDKLIEDGKVVSSDVSELTLRTDRSVTDSANTEKRAEKLVADAEDFDRTLNSVIQSSEEVLQQLKTVTERMGLGSSTTEGRNKMIEDAQRTLAEMKAINMSTYENDALDELDAAREALAEATTALGTAYELHNTSADISDLLSNLDKKLIDFNKQMMQASIDEAEALRLIKQFKSSPVQSYEHTIQHDVNDTKVRLEAASNDLKLAADLIPTATEIREDLPDAVNQLNETIDRANEIYEKRELELPLIPQLQEKAKVKADELSNQAAKFELDFAETRTAAHEGVEAAKSYEEILKSLELARKAAENASIAGLNAMEQSNGQHEQAKSARSDSANLGRNATKVRASLVNDVEVKLKERKEELKATQELLDKQNEREKHLNAEITKINLGDLKSQMDEAKTKAEAAQQQGQEIKDRIEEIKNRLPHLRYETGNQSTVISIATRDSQSIREQLERSKPLIPEAKKALEEVTARAANVSDSVDDLGNKLEALRRKLQYARDMANKVKIGVELKSNSYLQAHTPPLVSRSAAFTKLSMYFKTAENQGLLFFFGNERGATSTRLIPTDDFMALEIDSGRPKLTYDLGSGKAILWGYTNVADGRWHKVTIQRTGKSTKMVIETEGQNPSETSGVSPGTASVFNLHQDVSKFYVGGVPESAKLPSDVTTRHFIGQIEEVEYHNEPIGLWNFAHSGQYETYGVPKRDQLRPEVVNAGLNFDGTGYMVMERGAWNPRKDMVMKFTFRTFAKNALLFYMPHTTDGDFLAVQMSGGHVVTKYELGSGQATLTSEATYNDGNWHHVHIKRTGQRSMMSLDSNITVEGDSPGGMFELNLEDRYYLGGVPGDVPTYKGVISKPLVGCLDKLQVEGASVNFRSNIASLGVHFGCPPLFVRTVTFDAPGGHFTFHPVELGSDMNLTLKFKTKASRGVLFVASDGAGTNALLGYLDLGNMKLVTNKNNQGDVVEIRTVGIDLADGMWHFLTVGRKSDKGIYLQIDDRYLENEQFGNPVILPSGTDASLRFGSLDGIQLPRGFDSGIPSFLGCIGDVTYNENSISFSNAKHDGNVILTGCAMEEVIPTAPPDDVEQAEGVGLPPATLMPEPPIEYRPRPQEGCILGLDPLGQREDSEGFRFGTEPEGRLEFDKLPEPFGSKANFSLQFRATAWDGILLYAANAPNNPKRDFFALFLRQGSVRFSFDCGSGIAELATEKTYTDGEFHTVVAYRDGKDAKLYVDGQVEAIGSAPGTTTAIDVDQPVYVGGIPQELAKKSETHQNTMNINPLFHGCLREFKLNGQQFGEESNNVGVALCSDYSEKGLNFGKNGGYAIVDHALQLDGTISVEFDARPRVQNAVLLSIRGGQGDSFINLQIFNGVLRFRVNFSGKTDEANYTLPQPMSFCDGHWHRIKIYKTANVMTLSFDGISKVQQMKVIKGSSAETSNAPLYLGGVPAGHSYPGLDSMEPFVGCIKNLQFSDRPRRRKSVKLENIAVEGDVSKDGCPIN